MSEYKPRIRTISVTDELYTKIRNWKDACSLPDFHEALCDMLDAKEFSSVKELKSREYVSNGMPQGKRPRFVPQDIEVGEGYWVEYIDYDDLNGSKQKRMVESGFKWANKAYGWDREYRLSWNIKNTKGKTGLAIYRTK